VDDLCGIGNFMASGIDHWLHDGRGHSYPAGHCYHHCAGQSHSRAEARLKVQAIYTKRVLITEAKRRSSYEKI
jgi:hypothetical protein